MARESQGIQIALIIFVMLSIVLGVTTYLYVQRNGEVLKANADANKNASDAQAKLHAAETDIADLKRMIGFNDKSAADIKAAFDDDMKKYGANFPEDSRVYHVIVERLHSSFDKINSDFLATTNALTKLQGEFATREQRGRAQLTKIEGSFTDVRGEIDKVVLDYKTQEQAREDMRTREIGAIKTIKTTADAKVKVLSERIKADQTVIANANTEVKGFADTVRKLSSQTMDVPGGEITWVNQRSRTIWLNRGREDHLERQTKFGVYSGEAGGMSKVKKAEIEVVRVVDDHTAEARILDDTISNPIMPGDKIYTPLWSPGQQTHFALAGVMDLDGDGRNAIATVRGLITSNGAVVDCYMDNDGTVVGEVKGSTRIIVLGDSPGAKSPAKVLKAYGDVVSQAEHVSATKMTLVELKEKLDYKKASTVEHFGAASDTGDISKAAAAIKAAPKKKSADKDAAPSGDTQ